MEPSTWFRACLCFILSFDTSMLTTLHPQSIEHERENRDKSGRLTVLSCSARIREENSQSAEAEEHTLQRTSCAKYYDGLIFQGPERQSAGIRVHMLVVIDGSHGLRSSLTRPTTSRSDALVSIVQLC